MLVLGGLAITIFFNNCGAFYTQDRNRFSSSTIDDENYPWPNDSTTLTDSSERISKVTFGDIDKDFVEDGVFVSNSKDSDQPMIRVIQAGTFKEHFNIAADPSNMPNPKVPMYLFDMDMNNSGLELFYVSMDNSKIVALDLVTNPGTVKGSWDTVEVMDHLAEYNFTSNRMANAISVEVGNNMLIFSTNAATRMISGLSTIDGGWSTWDEWHEFANGTTCSKACGDGIEVRNRLCNTPEPRNGGAYCPAQNIGAETNVLNVHMRTCRLRDCDISECGSNEIFNNGSCDRDPNAPPPYTPGGGTGGVGGTGGNGDRPIVGGGTGGTGGTGGGIPSPDDCTSGEVWDPAFFRCFKAYTYNNISINYTERRYEGDREGGGWVYIDHTYRLGLNHPSAVGFSPKDTAREYCVHRGKVDVVSYEIGNYTAGSSGGLNGTNVFVLCNAGTNGLFYQGYYSRCPVGNIRVSFAYSGMTYSAGQNVQYLRRVTCRNND